MNRSIIKYECLKSFLSMIFVFMTPFFCGGLLPVLALHYGVPGEYAVGGFVLYIIVYFGSGLISSMKEEDSYYDNYSWIE